MHTLSSLSEPLIYLVAFSIVLSETGIAPLFFLPGDTLLFSLGIFAHEGLISLKLIIAVVFVAAVAGNFIGYHLGSFVRGKHTSSRLLHKIPERYIQKTELFYKRFGVWTVILSRFVPVIRTVAPFLAGVSHMKYRWYLISSVIGAALWTVTITLVGFLFSSYITVEHASLIAGGLMLTASILTPVVVFLSKKYFSRG